MLMGHNKYTVMEKGKYHSSSVRGAEAGTQAALSKQLKQKLFQINGLCEIHESVGRNFKSLIRVCYLEVFKV